MQIEDAMPLCHPLVVKPAGCKPLPVDEYNDALGKICGAFHVEAGEDSRKRVNGSLLARQFGRFDAALVKLDARRVLRDPGMIRRDPGEHLFLLFQQEGQSHIQQGGRTAELLPGDFFIVDSAVPSDFIYGGRHSAQVSLHLPRREMQSRAGQICTGGLAIDRNHALAPALRGVLTQMLCYDPGSPALAEALLNILTAYCHSLKTGSESVSSRLYDCAVGHITRRAPDPDFGVDALASDMGVSRRTLQRTFYEHGDSVSGRLQATRLDLARSRILSGGRNIAALAFECGFNDVSHFYRLFRERFGAAPGHLRDGHLPLA